MSHNFNTYLSEPQKEFWELSGKLAGDILIEHLPAYGYGDNEAAIAICKPFGEIVYQVRQTLLSFYVNAGRGSTNSPWLDMAGVSQGFFSFGFWDRTWDNSIKQALLYHSQEIWQGLGTERILLLVAGIFGLSGNLWFGSGPFLVADDAGNGGRVSGPEELYETFPALSNFSGFFLLPLTTPRGSKLWALAGEILEHFTPATVSTQVAYDQFYCNYSATGEPILS
jgi:hypothetical protein